MQNKQGFFTLDRQRLEYQLITPGQQSTGPTLVFLHEGLGCVALWRDFPEQVARATGLQVLIYSRAGYGQSDSAELPRSADYMHHEAQRVLPQVLAAAGIDQFILVGHSDGGSIALIYAGSTELLNIAGLILLAPHVFNETACVESIQQAGRLYQETDLRQRLARYHSDVDNAFWGWHDVWLTAAFWEWNIELFLARINIPILLIQGENDQYGTLAQIDAVEHQATGLVQRLVLSDCGHAPHQDQPEIVLNSMVNFITTCAGQ